MAQGSWSMRLRDDTPFAIRDSLRHGDTIIVTPQPIPIGARADVIAQARWRGVLTQPGLDGLEHAGAGMQWYLDNGNGAGGWVNRFATPSNPKTWAQHLTQMVSGVGATSSLTGLARFTVTAVGTAPSGSWPSDDDGLDDLPDHVIPRMRYIAAILGAEWRITPAGVLLHSSENDNTLFRVTTPRVVLNPREHGRDLDVIGFRGVEISGTTDISDMAAGGWALYDAGFGQTYIGTSPDTPTAIGDDFPHMWLHDGYGWNPPGATGLPVYQHAFVDGGALTDSSDATDRAQALANARTGRIRLRASARAADPGREVKPGDWCWVDDPQQNLVDTTQAVMWHGCYRTPKKMRLFGMGWQATEQMGVYRVARSLGDAEQIVDLTDWFIPGDDTVEMELGDFVRTDLGGGV
jgi:hypothetical protein